VIAEGAINTAILRLYTALKNEDGQTFVEYSLIVVLIAVVLVGVLVTLEGRLGAALGYIGARL
jgi:Flp pilus assembly pilin Flp